MTTKLLESKLALISGGSSGIGLAMAKRVAREGASVIILARDEEKLASAKESILAQTVSSEQFVETISIDMRDFNALEKALTPVLSS